MAYMCQENIFKQQTGISSKPEIAVGALNNTARKYGHTFFGNITQNRGRMKARACNSKFWTA